MISAEYIKAKFQAWAAREAIQLQGSAGERGESNYTLSVEKNLLGGILHPSTRKSLEAAPEANYAEESRRCQPCTPRQRWP